MNIIHPSAPEPVVLFMLVPKLVSLKLIEASIAGPSGPSRYLAAAAW